MCKDLCLITKIKEINSKWIKHLHVRPETMKFLEVNRGTLQDTRIGKDFWIQALSRDNKTKLGK
jgi:hypothetical protein